MSSFTSEMKELVKRYMKENIGYTMPDDDFRGMRHMELCAAYFTALAYFKMGNHYFSLDDVPDPVEGQVAFIREYDTTKQYRYRKGEWVYIQQTPDYIYKD